MTQPSDAPIASQHRSLRECPFAKNPKTALRARMHDTHAVRLPLYTCSCDERLKVHWFEPIDEASKKIEAGGLTTVDFTRRQRK